MRSASGRPLACRPKLSLNIVGTPYVHILKLHSERVGGEFFVSQRLSAAGLGRRPEDRRRARAAE